MEFYFKDGAKTRFLNEVCDAFREQWPAIYHDFMNHVKAESKKLVNPSGMSKDGHFMIRMYLPSKLYSFVKWQARKRLGIDEFFNDRENYDLLSKVWAGCEAKRQQRLFYDAVATAQKREQHEQAKAKETSPETQIVHA